MNLLLKIILSCAVCLGLGFLSGLVTMDEIQHWYAGLNKPFFNPPNWIFGPAWSILYLLMGISFALYWQRLQNAGMRVLRAKGTKYFGIQFALNLAWSFIFFKLHNPLFAFIEICILWLFILLTIAHFYKIHRTAGWLLIPYILWVSFASLLTISIYLLN
jgi:benzodiazapine receptor